MAEFNDRLKELRLNAQMTQTELGDVLGVTTSAVGMYEKGHRTPDINIITKIADHFGVSTDYLIGRAEYKNTESKKAISENLKKLMKLRGINRRQLSDALNIPYTTITSWIKGTAYPRIDKIEIMARYFRVKKSDLIEPQAQKELHEINETIKSVDSAIARAVLDEIAKNDPEMAILISAKSKLSKRDLRTVIELIERLQKLNELESG